MVVVRCHGGSLSLWFFVIITVVLRRTDTLSFLSSVSLDLFLLSPLSDLSPKRDRKGVRAETDRGKKAKTDSNRGERAERVK